MKKQYTFTIEEVVYKEFNDKAKIESINKSLFVENSIKEFLKRRKEK
jgi:hypothetical protein